MPYTGIKLSKNGGSFPALSLPRAFLYNLDGFARRGQIRSGFIRV
jgi:hypothetical protein